MPKMIDGDALMRQVIRKKPEAANARWTEGWNEAMMCVRSMIHSAPDLSLIRATWVKCSEYDEYGNVRCECSNCRAGVIQNPSADIPYCWKCGASMNMKEEKPDE